MPFLETASRLLEELLNSKDTVHFKVRITSEYLESQGIHEEYLSLISKPIDLLTIRENIAQDLYKNDQEAVEDMKLVFKNAIRFNAPQVAVHGEASVQLKAFEKKLRAPKVKARMAREEKARKQRLVKVLASEPAGEKMQAKALALLAKTVRRVEKARAQLRTRDHHAAGPLEGCLGKAGECAERVRRGGFDSLLGLHSALEEVELLLLKENSVHLVKAKQALTKFLNGLVEYTARQKNRAKMESLDLRAFVSAKGERAFRGFFSGPTHMNMYTHLGVEVVFLKKLWAKYLDGEFNKALEEESSEESAEFCFESVFDRHQAEGPVEFEDFVISSFDVLRKHQHFSSAVAAAIKRIAERYSGLQALFNDTYCDFRCEHYLGARSKAVVSFMAALRLFIADRGLEEELEERLGEVQDQANVFSVYSQVADAFSEVGAAAAMQAVDRLYKKCVMKEMVVYFLGKAPNKSDCSALAKILEAEKLQENYGEVYEDLMFKIELENYFESEEHFWYELETHYLRLLENKDQEERVRDMLVAMYKKRADFDYEAQINPKGGEERKNNDVEYLNNMCLEKYKDDIENLMLFECD